MVAAEVDSEGYLIDPRSWRQDWAESTAEAAGIGLTAEHWSVLRFIRAYYEEHGVPPDARFAIRHLRQAHGALRNRLFELFPFGYAGDACRIAGMRKPRIWSTG